MMTARRRLLGFLLFSALLIGCSHPFIDISISTGRNGQNYDVAHTGDASPGLSPLPIEKFVRKRAAHGLSLTEMRAYGKNNRDENVRVLSEMLKKPNCGKTLEDGRVCSNIVTTLGAIGGEPALDALKKFLTGEKHTFRDRTDALKAIGLWINSSGDIFFDPTLKTLTEFVTESVVEKRAQTKVLIRKVKKEDQDLRQILEDLRASKPALSKPALKNDLIRSAISGLVFAGGPRQLEKPFVKKSDDRGRFAIFAGKVKAFARKGAAIFDTRDSQILATLTELSDTVIGESKDKVALHDFVVQALREHKKIVQVGLDCYAQQGRQALSKGCKKQLVHSEDQKTSKY